MFWTNLNLETYLWDRICDPFLEAWKAKNNENLIKMRGSY